MNNPTKNPRHLKGIAVASAILAVTLSAPAFAGAQSGSIRGDRASVVRQQPVGPLPPFAADPGKKDEPKSDFHDEFPSLRLFASSPMEMPQAAIRIALRGIQRLKF